MPCLNKSTKERHVNVACGKQKSDQAIQIILSNIHLEHRVMVAAWRTYIPCTNHFWVAHKVLRLESDPQNQKLDPDNKITHIITFRHRPLNLRIRHQLSHHIRPQPSHNIRLQPNRRIHLQPNRLIRRQLNHHMHHQLRLNHTTRQKSPQSIMHILLPIISSIFSRNLPNKPHRVPTICSSVVNHTCSPCHVRHHTMTRMHSHSQLHPLIQFNRTTRTRCHRITTV